jgi:predicted nucleic acid-binding OB-fold protein
MNSMERNVVHVDFGRSGQNHETNNSPKSQKEARDLGRTAVELVDGTSEEGHEMLVASRVRAIAHRFQKLRSSNPRVEVRAHGALVPEGDTTRGESDQNGQLTLPGFETDPESIGEYSSASGADQLTPEAQTIGQTGEQSPQAQPTERTERHLRAV